MDPLNLSRTSLPRGSSLLELLVALSLFSLILALSTPAVTSALRYAVERYKTQQIESDARRLLETARLSVEQQNALWCLPLSRVHQHPENTLEWLNPLPETEAVTSIEINLRAAKNSFCSVSSSYEAMLAINLDGTRILHGRPEGNCSNELPSAEITALESLLGINASHLDGPAALYIPIAEVKSVYIDNAQNARVFLHLSSSSQPLAKNVVKFSVSQQLLSAEIASPVFAKRLQFTLPAVFPPKPALPNCIDVIL
ncbi:MAG: hypothetical protein KDD66_05195 [Bdellovibrionales bacterium]|nr:hypothetical protein [Bdellovibrionales bacterium]